MEAVALVTADQCAVGTRSVRRVRRQDRLHLFQQESTGILLPQHHGCQLCMKTGSLKALRHFLSALETTVNAPVISRCVTCIWKTHNSNALHFLNAFLVCVINMLHCGPSFPGVKSIFYCYTVVHWLFKRESMQEWAGWGAGTRTRSRAISGPNQPSGSWVQSEQRGCDVSRASHMIKEGAAWLGCWSCEWNKEAESGTKVFWWRWDTSVCRGGIWGPPMWLGEDKGLRMDN